MAMFEFDKNTYQWCSNCDGNVRRNAHYCRYCRKAIGCKLLKPNTSESATYLVSSTAYWLPEFDLILKNISPAFRARIEEADLNAKRVDLKSTVSQQDYMTAERNAGLCPPLPPLPNESGLLIDLMLSLHAQNFPSAPLCEDPRLQLLGVTPGLIESEAELRALEYKTGEPCKYCAEYILGGENACRFCEGSPQKPPNFREVDMTGLSRYDESLLRRVLVYEAAQGILEGKPAIDASLLSARLISDEEIERQILSIRSVPGDLPRSSWRDRMFSLGIDPIFFDECNNLKTRCSHRYDINFYLLFDIVALADSLLPSINQEPKGSALEGDVVFEHILSRWQSNAYFRDFESGLLAGKVHACTILRKHEEAEHWRAKLRAVRRPLEKLSPSELKEVLSSAKDYQQAVSDRENLKAMAAIETATGNFTKAAVLYHQLINECKLNTNDCKLNASAGSQDLNLCEFYCGLAEALLGTGDSEGAESSFQEAFQIAQDHFEAGSFLWVLAEVHHKYARYLVQTSQFDKARQSFLRSIEIIDAQHQRNIVRGYRTANNRESDGLLSIKEEYLSLLRRMDLDEEFASLEANLQHQRTLLSPDEERI